MVYKYWVSTGLPFKVCSVFDSLWAWAIFISEVVETTTETGPFYSHFFIWMKYIYVNIPAFVLCVGIFMCLLVIFYVNVCMFTFSEFMHECLCLLFDVLLCGAAPWPASP